MSTWKDLDTELLSEAEVETRAGLTRIPYRKRDGSVHNTRLYGNGRCWWDQKNVGVIPYGLERLPAKGSEADYTLLVAEGESDSLAARWAYRDRADICVLGLPGAQTWNPAWRDLVASFGRIVLLGDGDAAGESMNKKIRRDIPQAVVVSMPAGRDARDVVQEDGPEALDELIGGAAQTTPEKGATDDIEFAPELPFVEPETPTYEATDLWNAERFAELHGQTFRYVKDRKMWLTWNGKRWQRDATGEAERAAKETVKAMLHEAAEREDRDRQAKLAHWALRSQSEARLRAMLNLASTEEPIALSFEGLDANPWLLACANGTLDLQSGVLRPHDPAELISLGTDVPYLEDAVCPRWLNFLEEVFAEDAELVSFVKRAVGYSLTGITRDHVLFVLHGLGRNGKTTLVETVKRLLGDLATTAPFHTFTRGKDRGARNDLARLHRARLVAAAESGEGWQLDEATVKTLTGGDTVAARFLYSEFFEFRPAFKLWLITNHRPKVDGEDDAIWARIRLVPFDVNFEGREDRNLDATLQAELPGILAWAVEGCREWQEHGLGSAPAVDRATGEYRQDEDVLGAFLTDRCELSGWVKTAALRGAYLEYMQGIGERPLGANELGKRLKKRGIKRARFERSIYVYEGLQLTAEA